MAWFGLLIFACLAASTLAGRQVSRDEVFSLLMNSYDSSNARYNRPEGPVNDTLTVNVNIYLVEITSVDLETGIADLLVYVSYNWVDPRLRWDQMFSSVETLYVPHEMIWNPDIQPYRGIVRDPLEDYNAVVFRNGSVGMMPKFTLRTRCLVDRDTTTLHCGMRFGSWTYGSWNMAISMVTEAFDLSFYFENTEWELLVNEGRHQTTEYACCPEPYDSLDYTIDIRRRQ